VAHQSLLSVRLGRIDQVNERIRLFRLHLESGPVNVRSTFLTPTQTFEYQGDYLLTIYSSQLASG
jgi:hypothetical protein